MLQTEQFQQAPDVLLAAGDTLLREGEPSASVYCVVEGEITIWKATKDGPLELAKLRRGQVIGEMSVLDGGSASASATASAPTRLRAIPAEAFREAVQKDPAFALQITQVLISRLREADSRIAQLPDRRKRSASPAVASQPAAAQAADSAPASDASVEPSPPPVPVEEVVPVIVTLEGLTGPAQAALPSNPYEVPRLPCRIGRGGSDTEAYNDVVIKDFEPFQISMNHLLIFQERRGGDMQGRIGLFDRGSERGTWIDDSRLGELMGDECATFLEGDSAVLVLGDQDSVFRFRLSVRKA